MAGTQGSGEEEISFELTFDYFSPSIFFFSFTIAITFCFFEKKNHIERTLSDNLGAHVVTFIRGEMAGMTEGTEGV